MEFEVTKDKNLVSFLGEGKNKPYVFDVNTGILYSMQSKPLKNMPTTLQGYINRHNEDNAILFLMSTMLNSTYRFGEGWTFRLTAFANHKDLFMLVDKLNSIGYKPNHKDYSEFYPQSLNMINEYFKDFAKYYNEVDEGTIYDFIISRIPALWAESHGIEINEMFNLDFVSRLIEENFAAEQLKYVINTICRGALYFYMMDNGELVFYEFLRDIKEYFRICEVLDMKYEKDFFRGLINAKRAYQTYKEDFDNKSIQIQYQKHNFNYENDEFEIIVPQTTKDFKNEADQQHNCVYSCYLRMVIRGETNVVFIRKKNNPNKSFITCEITNKGTIKQYLYKFNESVKDKSSSEYQFKLDLQNWLNENWE